MDKSIKNLSSVTIVGLDIAKNVFQVHGARIMLCRTPFCCTASACPISRHVA
jgi:hypothetical protein